MKIVVDTNIIFSGLLNPNGTISDLLLNSSNKFDFYAPTFVLEELEYHRPKLLNLSGLSKDELNFLQLAIFKKVELIDMASIKNSTFEKAYMLTKDIDKFDTPFIALALELRSPLWTGDKKLRKGLSKVGIEWVLTTDIIAEVRDAD